MWRGVLAAVFWALGGLSPAWALSAEALWRILQDQSAATGGVLRAGAIERAGDVVTLTDVTWVSSSAEAVSEARLARLHLREMVGGEVELTADPDVTLRMQLMSEFGAAEPFVLNLRQTGGRILADGMAEDLTLRHDIPDLRLASAQPIVLGVQGESLRFALQMSDVFGQYRMQLGAMRQIESEIHVGQLDADFELRVGAHVMAGRALQNDIRSVRTGAVPMGLDPSDLAANLAAGLRTDVVMSLGPLVATMAGGRQFGWQSHALTERLSRERFDQRALITEGFGRIAEKSAVVVTVDEFAWDVSVPLPKQPITQEAEIGLRIDGLQLSNAGWNMIDRAMILPRDPIDVAVDLRVGLRWLMDAWLLTPQDLTSDTVPVVVETVTLNGARLSAMGAELVAKGALAALPTDLSGSTAAPTGVVDLTLTGGLTLLDKLAAAGLLAPDQAAGAKLILGLFSTEGAAPDIRHSQIEMRTDGSIFANGAQLQ